MTVVNYPLFSELGGSTRQIRRLPDPNEKNWSAFNPSIAWSPKGYAATIRSSNYVIMPPTDEIYVVTAGPIRNRVWFCELTDSLDIDKSTLRQIDFNSGEYNIIFKRGVEDAKLFWRGAWWFTGTILEREVPIARVGLFQLQGDTAVLRELLDYDWLNPKRVEKNWMVSYERNAHFDYIYGPTTVVRDGELMEVRKMSDALIGLRGSGHLWGLGTGSYLAIVHKMYPKPIEVWDLRTFSYRKSDIKNYTHLFARYSSEGVLTGLSQEFQFESSGIEFAAGIVVDGGDVYVSYGSKDVSSHIATIKLKTVMKMLEDV